MRPVVVALCVWLVGTLGCSHAATSSDATLDGATADRSAADLETLDQHAAPDAPCDLECRDAPTISPDADATDVSPPSVCIHGDSQGCECVPGLRGARVCFHGQWRRCVCTMPLDAGASPAVIASRPLPPRLITPQSASRVSSQRPTMRWVLPGGVLRARVEVCRDRPCSRVERSAVVDGTSWRPTERLSRGVWFWRVRGLDGDGGVVWSSATWEFFVGPRDAPNDTSYGNTHDFNADGYDDEIVDRIQVESTDSAIEIHMGSPKGLQGDRSALLHSTVHSYTTTGTIGDVNGDGFGDLVFKDNASVVGLAGTWNLVLGGERGIDERNVITLPLVEGAYVVLNSIGGPLGDFCDVDGDGFQDVIAPGGLLRGYSGPPYGYLLVVAEGGPVPSSSVGYTVADPNYFSPSAHVSCIGDMDLDGYPEVLVQRETDGSRYYIYHGGPGGLRNALFQNFAGTPDSDLAGVGRLGQYRVSGDFNGDSRSDVAMMGDFAAVCYYGRAMFDGYVADEICDTVAPELADTGAGETTAYFAVSGAVGSADFNGDGRGDLVVVGTRPLPSCVRNIALEYDGTSTPELRRHSMHVVRNPDMCRGIGRELLAGDYNGDGFTDMLSIRRTVGDFGGGVGYVFSGGTEGLLAIPYEFAIQSR